MPDQIDTKVTAPPRSRVDSLKNFGKNFAIAHEPANDIIPLLARGKEKQAAVFEAAIVQAAAPGAKLPLPRLNSSSKSLGSSPNLTARDMVPPKSASSAPDASLSNIFDDSSNAGTNSFDMQAREIDEAKARTPNIPYAPPYDMSGAPGATQHNFAGSNGGTTRGNKKKSYNKSKKPNGDRPPHPFDQPKPYGEHSSENTNSNMRPWKHRRDNYGWNDNSKPRDDIIPQTNKPDGPPRGNNRSITLNEGKPPRGQYQDKTNFRSLRQDPRSNFNEKQTVRHNTFQGNGPNTPPRHNPLHQVPPEDPRGFHSPSGSWYPREAAQVHVQAGMVQQMHGAPPPPLMRFMGQNVGMPMLGSMPPPHAFGMTPPHFVPQGMPPPLNMAQEKTTAIPPPPCVIPKSAPPVTQNTPSTGSVKTVVPAATKVPVSIPQSNTKDAIREVPPLDDPRPPHIQVHSCLNTVVAQLQHLIQRIHPTTKPEHIIEPAELAYHLNTAINLCFVTQLAAKALTEGSPKTKEDFDAVVRGGPAERESESTRAGEGSLLRSQSMSPQQTQLRGNIAETPSASGEIVSISSTEGNIASATTQSRGQGFVVPPHRYSGFAIDETKHEQVNGDKSLAHDFAGPWWIRKQRESWDRVNFESGEEQEGTLKNGR